MSAAGQPPGLVDRLRGVRVGLREDLDVSRHVFRGQACYIVRDPVTFQSHRFEPADYEVMVSIDPTLALEDVFVDLVNAGTLAADDEERFYSFVFQLHRFGFLHLPVADDKILYRRYRSRQMARKKRRLLSLMFLRIPLWDPDAFLNRTMHLARPIFTRLALVVWLLLMVAAGVVAAARWQDLVEPLNGLLAARNLPLIWVMLILLKACHEFGHAYACKHFGGHVPEMGAYFIMGTPCAYVDATACWGFTQRYQRLVVCLAGIYVETFLAALALFVWALTGPGLLNSVMYNVIFLAGITTILFNINPLMRYDGYYVFSDLVEIPNLRPRATAYVLNVLKRHVVGVRAAHAQQTLGMRVTLFTFGVCSTIYRTLVLTGIAALIATKFLLLGLGLAALYLGSTLWRLGKGMFGYLWYAEETAPVRRRAVATSVALIAGVPLLLCLAPVRSSISAAGVLRADRETVLRADSDGFVTALPVRAGRSVKRGAVLVQMENDTLEQAALEARCELEVARLQRDAYRVEEPGKARTEQRHVESLKVEDARRTEQVRALTVAAPAAGRLIQALEPRDVGRFVKTGQELATIASGPWQVRVQLSEEQMAACNPHVGDTVEFRPVGATGTTIAGRVERIRPLGSREVDLPELTQFGGGDIIVNQSHHAAQPYFEIRVALDKQAAGTLRHGLTGQVRFTSQHQPIGLYAYRRVMRFINGISES